MSILDAPDQIVGFTGTQVGMTNIQAWVFRIIISNINPATFIHGDCIGADTDADEISKKIVSDLFTWIMPCNIESKRSFCEGTIVEDPEKPLDRNKKIVDASNIMIACPKTKEEEMRSGTWSTIRYARKKKKPLIIIPGDGMLWSENIEIFGYES